MDKINISRIGSIAASLLSKSCCFGSVLFIVSGTSLGFLGRLSLLSAYGNYLLSAAVVMLGYSFWRIYLKNPGCVCRKNIRAGKIERWIFWLGVAAIIFALTFSRITQWIYG